MPRVDAGIFRNGKIDTKGSKKNATIKDIVLTQIIIHMIDT